MLDIFLRPIWATIVKWAAIIFGVFIILAKARQTGKDAERVSNLKATLEAIRKRDEIENNIAGFNDNQRKRMRKKWQR